MANDVFEQFFEALSSINKLPNEVIERYGGTLMENMDIDDEDFDWDNEDISTGEKVIATAVKKNRINFKLNTKQY